MLLVGAGLITAPAAHATSDTLPLPGYGDMVVDDARHRVFVSGGASANSVVVLDFRGRVIKKIDNQFGATGLVLSEDGKTLYVAQAAGDAVSAISTETYAETGRFATGAQTCPTHLARTGALVWFGYGCDDRFTGRIGRLDTAAAPPAVVLDKQGAIRFQRAPIVSSTGAATGPVFAAQTELSQSSVQVYAVENAELKPGAAGEPAGSNLTDVALSADGMTAFTASGSRDHVQGLSTTDLSGRGAYFTGPYPNAVATSADGRYLATGAYTTRNKAITVFRVGDTVPARAFSLGESVLAKRGLAWSRDGETLFAVVQRANDARPSFVDIDLD